MQSPLNFDNKFILAIFKLVFYLTFHCAFTWKSNANRANKNISHVHNNLLVTSKKRNHEFTNSRI